MSRSATNPREFLDTSRPAKTPRPFLIRGLAIYARCMSPAHVSMVTVTHVLLTPNEFASTLLQKVALGCRGTHMPIAAFVPPHTLFAFVASGARRFLRVRTDLFIMGHFQNVIVSVLALRTMFAVRQVEQRAWGWLVCPAVSSHVTQHSRTYVWTTAAPRSVSRFISFRKHSQYWGSRAATCGSWDQAAPSCHRKTNHSMPCCRQNPGPA